MNYVMRYGRRIAIQTMAAPIPTRRKRSPFIITSKAQSDRLDAARHIATSKVFRRLQFLIFKSRGKSIQLANVALTRCGVDRKAKGLALRELERLGLVQVVWHQHRSPEVTVLDLPDED